MYPSTITVVDKGYYVTLYRDVLHRRDPVALDERVGRHVDVEADASGFAHGVVADDRALRLGVVHRTVGEVEADASALQGVALDQDVVTGRAVALRLDGDQADAAGDGRLVGLDERVALAYLSGSCGNPHSCFSAYCHTADLRRHLLCPLPLFSAHRTNSMHSHSSF